MRYLDPKNDLVFKKVFGEKSDITISFLNALLPLENNETITSIEYLTPELVPDIPGLLKNSLVDVRCLDTSGRQFIVEMQMLWTDSFKSRVLFNASKAYVKQLDRGIEYKTLQPVYALSIVNDTFEKGTDNWYHHYKIIHTDNPRLVIDGLQFVFVELPKFKPSNFSQKKLTSLWMRYLSEIKNNTEVIDQELLKEMMAVPEMAKALELTKESAYTKAELDAYDRYWDAISTERSFIVDAEARGFKQGIEQGIEKEKIKTAEKLLNSGLLTIEQISDITGLSVEMIKKI